MPFCLKSPAQAGVALRSHTSAPRQWRSFSRFGRQDAQTPPSPLVGEGSWGYEEAKAQRSAANR